MTTLVPRPAYSPAELEKLYPSTLELEQVQILLRHGERTPVGSRFQNAGLAPYWPYCAAARQLKDVVLNSDGTWDHLSWRRRLERLGPSDAPTISAGSRGEVDAVCEPGELTDRGRETTLALGERIRNLYINQLAFLPTTATLDTDNIVSLRATPIQRALESVQQTYTGLYPPSQRAAGLPPKTIVRRPIQDETLFPNESACPRFRELAKAFADRTAKVWNDGPEMQYLNKKLGKWMPEATPKVAVDGHPRLSGLMDTINATRAHGPATKLPKEFYEEKVIGHVDRICTEEWFVGYQESNEYRTLGIGGLIGDLAQRMVERVRANDVPAPAAGAVVAGESDFKISLSGCHDTTIASALTALGGFDVSHDHWPNFTSNIAFELFRRKGLPAITSPAPPQKQEPRPSWWSTLFSSAAFTASATTTSPRTPLTELPPTERQRLDDYYVRLRYNDHPVALPFCAAQKERHLEGDESFCTLTAFKQAADSFTPKDWKKECRMNLGAPAMGSVISRPPGVGEDMVVG